MSKDIIEKLAKLEHQQWLHWSRSVSNLLDELLTKLIDGTKKEREKLWHKGMRTLVRWREGSVPYEKLSDTDKDKDRRWAIKALELVPIKCPVWRCGGVMQTVERKTENENQWKTPDLICANCGAIYQFKGFATGEEPI